MMHLRNKRWNRLCNACHISKTNATTTFLGRGEFFSTRTRRTETRTVFANHEPPLVIVRHVWVCHKNKERTTEWGQYPRCSPKPSAWPNPNEPALRLLLGQTYRVPVLARRIVHDQRKDAIAPDVNADGRNSAERLCAQHANERATAVV